MIPTKKRATTGREAFALQRLPPRFAATKELARAILPQPGLLLLDVDYGGLEIRIWAAALEAQAKAERK